MLLLASTSGTRKHAALLVGSGPPGQDTDKDLADEGERIPGIVEDMEKEDQDAQIMEQCGDSSDDERFQVLGEWREEGFGNLVVQDIRCPEFKYRVNEVIQGQSIVPLKM